MNVKNWTAGCGFKLRYKFDQWRKMDPNFYSLFIPKLCTKPKIIFEVVFLVKYPMNHLTIFFSSKYQLGVYNFNQRHFLTDTLYLLKSCPIFVGSLHKFGKYNNIMVLETLNLFPHANKYWTKNQIQFWSVVKVVLLFELWMWNPKFKP